MSQTAVARVRTAALGVAALMLAATLRLGASPAATPRLDWVVDGYVYATARIGNTLFVGGDFKTALPAAGWLGGLFALSPATGAVVPSGVQRLDFEAEHIAPDGAGGYYISGAPLGPPVVTGKVVRVRSDGSIDPAFQPPAGALVGPMARVGPSLVIGGFLQVNGVNRPLLALDANTGALSPWTPALPAGDDNVWEVVADGGRAIVLSGSYASGTRFVTAFDAATGGQVWQTDVTGARVLGGQAAMRMVGGRLIVGVGRLYALDPSTGVVDPSWAAGQVPSGGVRVIAAAGTAIYVGGAFTTFHGQPRANLAAVDAATGALLPWNPQASSFVTTMAASPSGTIFVGAPLNGLSINGVSRGLFAIDTTGALTTYTPEAAIDRVALLQTAPNGSLLVAGTPGLVGQVSRSGLAAFDLATGALLPEVPVLAGAPAAPSVRGLVVAGSTLYMNGTFTSVNGQPRQGTAAINGVTGALLPWTVSGATFSSLGPVIGNVMYGQIALANASRLRRIDATTGAVDPSWIPTADGLVVPDRGELLLLAPVQQGFGGTGGTKIGVLDPATGQFTEWLRSTLGYFSQLIPDGGTLYVRGTDPALLYGPFDNGETIYAFDRQTRVPVARPPVSGRLRAVALVDGRVLAGGRNITVAGVEKDGAVEASRTGELTGWDAGFGPYAPITGPIAAPGLVFHVAAHGDVVAVAGILNPQLVRIKVFDLSGANAPSGLRSRTAAGAMEFTWDPVATPPVGGYVLDGGFAPGQTVASIPVGSGTTFTTSASVLGPLFLRVRAAGSSEVSNEIVAGCVAPPLPPTSLVTAMIGTTLTLAWQAPLDAVTGYVLTAGTASGLSDVVTTPLPAAPTSISGTVPGGTFHARVQATNACGTSAPSGEVFFTIGAADPLPAAPTNLTSSVSGSTLSLSWTAPAGPVTGYVLEAGGAPGLANIGAATIGAATSFVIPGVPPGTYYVRVRGVTRAGAGAPSTDVVVVVP